MTICSGFLKVGHQRDIILVHSYAFYNGMLGVIHWYNNLSCSFPFPKSARKLEMAAVVALGVQGLPIAAVASATVREQVVSAEITSVSHDLQVDSAGTGTLCFFVLLALCTGGVGVKIMVLPNYSSACSAYTASTSYSRLWGFDKPGSKQHCKGINRARPKSNGSLSGSLFNTGTTCTSPHKRGCAA